MLSCGSCDRPGAACHCPCGGDASRFRHGNRYRSACACRQLRRAWSCRCREYAGVQFKHRRAAGGLVGLVVTTGAFGVALEDQVLGIGVGGEVLRRRRLGRLGCGECRRDGGEGAGQGKNCKQVSRDSHLDIPLNKPRRRIFAGNAVWIARTAAARHASLRSRGCAVGAARSRCKKAPQIGALQSLQWKFRAPQTLGIGEPLAQPVGTAWKAPRITKETTSEYFHYLLSYNNFILASIKSPGVSKMRTLRASGSEQLVQTCRIQLL